MRLPHDSAASLAVLLLLFFLPACASTAPELGLGSLDRFEFERPLLGKTARIVVYAAEEAKARKATDAAFRRLARIEQVASDYSSISELEVVNGLAGGGAWVPVSESLLEMLQLAVRVASATDGAFDPTIGPLTELWQRARTKRRLPAEQELHGARSRVGWKRLELDRGRRMVRLTKPGMRLEVGALVRGYAADIAIEEMKERGLPVAMIDIGGDVVVGDAPPGTEGWSVKLIHVADGAPIEVFLRDAAVATSGEGEGSFVIDGTRYSDVVDPRTGLGFTDELVATVVADSGALADALATAMRATGREEGQALAEAEGVRVWFR